MNIKVLTVVACAVPLAMSAAAQVTGSGTAGAVPVFTGTATLGNSPISISGSNVGIGTTSPTYPLQLRNSTAGCGNQLGAYNGSNYAILSVMGSAPCVSTWPVNSSVLESNQGGLVLDAIGSNPILFQINRATAMTVASGGNVGIGITAPYAKFQISDAAKLYSSVGNEFDSNAEIQGNYASKVIGQGPSLGFISPANTDGNNPWEMARILSSPDNANTADASGRMYLQTRYPNAGNWYWNNNLVLTSNGNVGIGTTGPGARLEVAGSVKLTAGTGASMTYQDGSVQTVAWNGVLSGGDYAESVDVIGDRTQYEPGDVMVIDSASKGCFMKSTEAYSTAVMGVYSTQPGVVGRRQKTDKLHMKDEVPMAMVGVVPTKVSAESGAIKPGDLLVTSSKAGYAMKGTDRSKMMGAIIGKALERLDSGTGVIEVAISIQ